LAVNDPHAAMREHRLLQTIDKLTDRATSAESLFVKRDRRCLDLESDNQLLRSDVSKLQAQIGRLNRRLEKRK
jgi:hypothetical protein